MSGAAAPDAADQLSSADRARIGRLWAKRASNERATSGVFAQLHAALLEDEVPLRVLRMSARAVEDELRHFELCTEIAAHYGVTAEFARVPAPRPQPFAGCSARRERLLSATLQCSLNETIAAAYLHACLAEATAGRAHDALREILSDEVRHARIGWALLGDPHVTQRERQAVAESMPDLLEACIVSWLNDEGDYPADLPRGHGCLTQSRLEQAVWEAAHDLIVPGLAHVGVDTQPARAWLERAHALGESAR